MQEKLALLEGARVAVVGTAPAALAAEARRRVPTIVAGAGPPADVRPDAAELDDGGHARIVWRGHAVTLPVVGFHHIENAMLALAVGREGGADPARAVAALRSEEHTSELQSLAYLVCRLLLEKKKTDQRSLTFGILPCSGRTSGVSDS